MKKNAFLTTLLTIGLLAGCGDPSNTTGGTSTNTGSGDKTITFWHCIGHDKMENLQRIIDKFNEDQGATGYQVKAERIAGSYDDLHDTVKTKLSAGQVPSITMGYPDSFAEYIGTAGAEKSQILNLDPFIENTADFAADDFVDMYYDEGKHYQYEGTWSMPLYKSTEVMYVNKEMFEGTEFYKNNLNKTYGSYGAVLTNPSTWDWDTFVYVAREIQKEKNPNGTIDFNAVGYDSDANLFITQMAMRGIPYTTATSNENAYEHILYVDPATGATNTKFIDLAEEVFTLTQEKVFVTQGSYGSYASDLFLSKKLMFTIGSTGGSQYNDPKGSTNAYFTCSLYSVPTYGAESNAKYIMQGPSLCFFNTKDTAKEQAAWDFYYNYLADPELNAALALENSYDPVRKSSYTTNNYKNWTANGLVDGKDDESKELMYRIPNLTATMTDSYLTSPVFIGSSGAREEIGQIIAYAQRQTAGSYRDKVTKAIQEAYENTIRYMEG